MREKIFSRQVALDGLVGVGVALLLLLAIAVVFVGGVYLIGGPNGMTELTASMDEFSEGLLLVNPVFYVLFVSFLGGVLGGWLLERVSSRKEWFINILLITFIMWVCGSILAIPYMAFYWGSTNPVEFVGGFLIAGLFVITIIAPGSGGCSLAGLIVFGILGAVIRPEKRIYKVLIGAVIGSLMGVVAGFIMLVAPLFGFA